MEIETKYSVDIWYSGSHVGMDGLYWTYKDGNERFILRVYLCGQDWCKETNEPRNIDLTENGYIRYKTKREAENAINTLKHMYPSHTLELYESEDWSYPYYVCMSRVIKTYDWRNKTLTSLGRTFEKEDEPTFSNRKAIITAKLNEVTKLLDLAFEVENSGK